AAEPGRDEVARRRAGALDENRRLTWRDAAQTDDRDRQGEAVRVVIHLPAGQVDGGAADVGDLEPIRRVGAVAAGPGRHLGDDQPADVADARRADLVGVPGGHDGTV